QGVPPVTAAPSEPPADTVPSWPPTPAAPVTRAAQPEKPAATWLVARKKSTDPNPALGFLQSRKRALIIGLAAGLAIVIVGSFISRQRLRASQPVVSAASPTATQVLSVPVEKPASQDATKPATEAIQPSKPPEEPPAPAAPTPTPEQTLRRQVR